MLVQAYRVYGKQSYLDAAVESAHVVWARARKSGKGLGLCHGLWGCAYAFLAVYRCTGDEAFLARAHEFFRFGVAHEAVQRPGDAPFSLMEGVAGQLYFAADLLQPNASGFPGFEFPAAVDLG